MILKDFTRSKYAKNDVEYLLEAKTEEMQTTWREIIEKCLWLQLLSAKGLLDLFQFGLLQLIDLFVADQQNGWDGKRNVYILKTAIYKLI